jgi:hypothetical protein
MSMSHAESTPSIDADATTGHERIERNIPSALRRWLHRRARNVLSLGLTLTLSLRVCLSLSLSLGLGLGKNMPLRRDVELPKLFGLLLDLLSPVPLNCARARPWTSTGVRQSQPRRRCRLHRGWWRLQ